MVCRYVQYILSARTPVTVHLCWFSSPMFVREGRDPAPGCRPGQVIETIRMEIFARPNTVNNSGLKCDFKGGKFGGDSACLRRVLNSDI